MKAVYSYNFSFFEKLLSPLRIKKDRSFPIHHRNIHILASNVPLFLHVLLKIFLTLMQMFHARSDLATNGTGKIQRQ